MANKNKSWNEALLEIFRVILGALGKKTPNNVLGTNMSCLTKMVGLSVAKAINVLPLSIVSNLVLSEKPKPLPNVKKQG